MSGFLSRCVYLLVFHGLLVELQRPHTPMFRARIRRLTLQSFVSLRADLEEHEWLRHFELSRQPIFCSSEFSDLLNLIVDSKEDVYDWNFGRSWYIQHLNIYNFWLLCPHAHDKTIDGLRSLRFPRDRRMSSVRLFYRFNVRKSILVSVRTVCNSMICESR